MVAFVLCIVFFKWYWRFDVKVYLIF